MKKSPYLRVEEILNKFIEDEIYYFNVGNPHFEFLKDFIEHEQFQNDALKYIQECKKYYEYKDSQKPFIEKQKEFEKQKRKFLQEKKMSKESPTKKQLYYYECLCKKYNIEKQDTSEFSKLDLKNIICGIIDEHSGDSKPFN
ncbi:hypothetical protein IJ818_01230 [bacterium]|nr:hypothetical protein [bacterium]